MIVDAVIPARGGSKRLPGKNVALLGDRPLVAHSIDYALAHPLVRNVYVTTDDPEIADVATQFGAQVITRPAELATDVATTSSALEHALRAMREAAPPAEPRPDALLTLQPTSPLRLAAWLASCVELLGDPRFDSAVTVSPVTAKVGVIVHGEFRPSYRFETRGQDLAPRFRENGNLYLTRTAAVAAGSVFGRCVGAVVTDHPFASIDIDTRADFEYAARLMGLAP